MNEQNADLLSQLRDIHGSGAPGWWPPAPGWWLLALLAFVALVVLLRWLGRRWATARRHRRLLDALTEIEQTYHPDKHPHDYLAGLNRLFRVVALKAFPGTSSVRLQGDEWVKFLQALLPEDERNAALSALATGPYEPQPRFNADELQQLAQTWVRKYG